MKKIISLICALMVVSGMALAQRGEPVVIPLWPNGAPNDNHLTGEEGHPDPRSVNNVSKPELWVYPAFSADDPIVSFEESIQYFRVLQQNRIPSVLHIYPTGGHGWCEGPWFHYAREWKAELERCLLEE